VSKHFKKTLLFELMIANLLFYILILTGGCKKDVAPVKPAEGVNAVAIAAVQSKPIAVPFFDAGLDKRGDLSAYAQTPGNPYSAMVIDPSRISVVNDPVYGAKRKAMLMDVRTQDNAGLTENPRAQVQTPMSYVAGQTVYVGFSVRFTQSLWTYFLTFSELYGAPYTGTSPFRLALQGSNLVASATDHGKQLNLWQEPMEAGIWYDFVYSEVLSTDASAGKVQVWLRKQGEKDYTPVLGPTSLATLTAANFKGPNYHKLACYYDKSNTYSDATKKTKIEEVKMYLAAHKVGSSFDLVAPAALK
jgi:hypothetical protein